MALFKRSPSTSEKNDIRALLQRSQSCARNLNTLDKIPAFCNEWEKLTRLYGSLVLFRRHHVIDRVRAEHSFVNYCHF